MDTLIQDWRFGLRLLPRQPAFPLSVVLTLALGARPADVLRLMILQGMTPALVLAGVAFLAAWLPARRATQADPAEALLQE